MNIRARVCMILTCCLAAAMLALAGCGAAPAKYADSEYVGTWDATTAEAYGISMKVTEILDEFTVVLDADGTATAKVNGQQGSGQWEETDTGCKITGGVVDNKDLDFAKKGEKLVLVYDQATITFEKRADGASDKQEKSE